MTPVCGFFYSLKFVVSQMLHLVLKAKLRLFNRLAVIILPNVQPRKKTSQTLNTSVHKLLVEIWPEKY